MHLRPNGVSIDRYCLAQMMCALAVNFKRNEKTKMWTKWKYTAQKHTHTNTPDKRDDVVWLSNVSQPSNYIAAGVDPTEWEKRTSKRGREWKTHVKKKFDGGNINLKLCFYSHLPMRFHYFRCCFRLVVSFRFGLNPTTAQRNSRHISIYSMSCAPPLVLLFLLFTICIAQKPLPSSSSRSSDACKNILKLYRMLIALIFSILLLSPLPPFSSHARSRFVPT